MIFGCLDLFFRCLNIYFMCLDLYFWVLDLYFGFWTCIWVSGLIFLVSELILWVSGSSRVGSGRAAGSGELNIWGKNNFGNLYLKKNRS